MLNPNSYDGLVLVGNIINELGKAENALNRAIYYYDQAITIDPADPKAYSAKAAALLDAGQFRSSLSPAIKAWRLTLSEERAERFDVEVTTVLSEIF